MTDQPPSTEAPRARPLGDAPIDPLLARAEELAKRWAMALVLASPLADLGDVRLEALAREGPPLIAQTLRALCSEVELERLTGDGAAGERAQPAIAPALREITAAEHPASLVEAVEALRGVLWEALLDELRDPSVRQVSDACDRLAHVCSRALAVAFAAADAGAPEHQPAPVDEVGDGRVPVAAFAASGAQQAVIIDEHVASARGGGRVRASHIPVRAAAASGLVVEQSARPTVAAPAVEIEIRDERVEAGPAAWIGSIGQALERFAEDGLPFAVLLVEVREIERIRRAAPASERRRLADRVEDVLAAELGRFAPGSIAPRAPREVSGARRSGSLTRERPGRYWLLAPRADRLSARRLGERLAQAVARSVRWQGTGIEVVIGTAICPEDGRDAPALAAHADVGLYADRASVKRHAAEVDEPS